VIRQFLRRHLPLIALFMLALPIFGWLRWQPQAWFAAQLTENNLSEKITYATVEKSFPGLAVTQASIRLSDGTQLVFDHLLLQPAMLTLLSGKPALFVRAEREGLVAESEISVADEKLILNGANIQADAGKLAAFDPGLQLLALKGELQLNGTLQLRLADGMPLQGDIQATWNQAATLLLPVLQSGTVHASLLSKNDEKFAPMWMWEIKSTPQSITGKGKIVTNGTNIENWLLRGNIHLKGDEKPDGNILSGTLGTPRWQ